MLASTPKHPNVILVGIVTFSPKSWGEMCQARERQQRMASKQQVKKRVKPGIGLHGTMSVHILDIRVRIG